MSQPFVPAKPALVVGIVIDQMRQDYLMRYWDLLCEEGFKKVIRNGYTFANAHYDYFPTYTGAGHANISTGASPSVNGIVGNEWYQKPAVKKVYCAADQSVVGVGAEGVVGQMSPKNMLTTTIGDELKTASAGVSRVFGIAIKDRGAILSAGHQANAAYWYDGASGNFITSSFYMTTLPKWVTDFNRRKLWDKYLNTLWRPSVELSKLLLVSTPDDTPYENIPKGMSKAVFPYDLKKLRTEYGPELITTVPWGNTLTFDFAKALLQNEKLGKRYSTDMLFISLSTPDYMGHFYGPRSVEIADMYLRLDKELADFIKTLEAQVGNNFQLFITADHGVADNSQYMKDRKIPAGTLNLNTIQVDLRQYLEATFGADLLDAFKNLQIYLNKDVIAEKGLSEKAVTDSIIRFLQFQEGILRVFPSSLLDQYNVTDDIMIRYQKGYFPQRCGDIYIIPLPGWLEMSWQTKGTTHGSPYTYDTHVPIIFYGKNISSGYTHDYVTVSQIAPTLAALLGISPPNGSFAAPLLRYLLKRE
jgi:predicted AlkP superfamily pyrophosphatase or phosphodiesterase